jgi:hypothetical protein
MATSLSFTEFDEKHARPVRRKPGRFFVAEPMVAVRASSDQIESSDRIRMLDSKVLEQL